MVGLKELYDFLTVPFLKAQERSYIERLQSIRAEMNTVSAYMGELHKGQDYKGFVRELDQLKDRAAQGQKVRTLMLVYI